MMLSVAPFFVAIVYFAIGLLNISFSEVLTIILLLLLYGSAIFIVFLNKSIGYAVQEDGEEPEEKLPWEILLGLTIFAIVIKLAVTYFQQFGAGNLIFSDLFSSNLIVYFPVLLLIPLTLIAWLMLKGARLRSRHFEKATLGILLLLGVFILKFVVKNSQSWELNQFSDYLIIFIDKIIFIPILLSIVTHINFSKHAGLWVGIVLGGPIFVVQLIELLVPIGTSLNIIASVAAFLLIAILIFLRENKKFILDILDLEESNQEADEEPPSDPMEHLVGE